MRKYLFTIAQEIAPGHLSMMPGSDVITKVLSTPEMGKFLISVQTESKCFSSHGNPFLPPHQPRSSDGVLS